MAFRYRNLRRVSRVLATPSGVRCQEGGQATKLFVSSVIPLASALEKIDRNGAWRGLYGSRFSTVAEISKEASHEIDLISFIRSTFDHTEGPYHCWLNRSEASNEQSKKDGVFFILADAFLEDSPGSWREGIVMLEKVKLFQQRYPWLHVFGFQSGSSISSRADHNHLMHLIMDEYISFPILLCSKTFPEMATGPCCMLFKGLKDIPLHRTRDADLGIFHEAIKELNEQLHENAGNADKLKSTWSKQTESLKEPYVCSSMRNLLLYLPACISADESGDRLFLSDSNHHRIIVFDRGGKILDAIGSSPGFEDGDFETAKLMRPAASYYHASENSLYLVDSENHAIRRADMGRRVLETLYPACNGKGKSGLWTWILDKMGLRRDAGMRLDEFASESLLFPWHLLKSEDNDLLIMNRRFDILWIMEFDSGVIRDVVKGHQHVMDVCGEKIMEKVSKLKDLSCDFLQQLVYCPSYGEPYSALLSSFVTFGDHFIFCDTVGQRVLMLNEVASSIELSNFAILGLPYWLSCSLERVFTTGDVYEEAHVDHLQSFTFFPGKVDIHLTVDIPGNTKLVEPLQECCVWRQVRGAAIEVSGAEHTAASSEKVGVAQQWYDELDNLALSTESEVFSEEKSASERNLEDGKIHIDCIINTSPGTSEVIVSAPIYLKLNSESCEDTQETKAAKIADILKLERKGRSERDAFIHSVLKPERDLGELVFMKPLRVKIRFNILNHPKPDNSRDIILTDSVVSVNVSLY